MDGHIENYDKFAWTSEELAAGLEPVGPNDWNLKLTYPGGGFALVTTSTQFFQWLRDNNMTLDQFEDTPDFVKMPPALMEAVYGAISPEDR